MILRYECNVHPLEGGTSFRTVEIASAISAKGELPQAILLLWFVCCYTMAALYLFFLRGSKLLIWCNWFFKAIYCSNVEITDGSHLSYFLLRF